MKSLKRLSIVIVLMLSAQLIGQTGVKISDLNPITASTITDDTLILFGTANLQDTPATPRKLSLAEIKLTLPIRAVGNDSFVINPADNAIDATVFSSVITGAGRAADPNKIGFAGKPTGTDYTPRGYADDTGYVAGAADVATISGGYDNVVNAIASTVAGGGHNFVKYGVQGHSFVGGGSYNVIDAGRSVIVGGRLNTITGGDTYVFNFLGGGDDNELITSGYSVLNGGTANEVENASYSVVGGGRENVIDFASPTTAYSTIGGGYQNTVTAEYATVLGGQGNSVTVVGGTAGGRQNTVSGDYATAFGYGNTVPAAGGYGVTMGLNAKPVSPGLTIGRGQLVELGDAQAVTEVQAIRTSNATLTNLSGTGSRFIELDDTRKTAGTGKILLTAIRDGSANGNGDGNYDQVSYELEFGFFWDGTNAFLFKDGAETTVSASPILDMNLISQTNHDFAPGAAPHIAINTGSLRIKVTGIAATAINWVARIDMAMTLVD
jgi:hypothetical protein